MKIENIEQLRELYAQPNERAEKKQLAVLDRHSAGFIGLSPFFVLATSDKEGRMDASPRGGKPGFVKTINSTELVFADAKGNNRLDSLSNIVETGKAGLLFLVPGFDETLRLNGRAQVSVDPKLLALFGEEQNPPKTCVIVTVEEVYMHCAKAFMRSRLWLPEAQLPRSSFPTIGQVLKDQLSSLEEAEPQEEMVKRYQKDL